MSRPWQKLSSKYLHQNPWFKLREDKVINPSGKKGSYYVMEIRPTVVIVPVNEAGEICLIHEYRHPSQKWLWEVPIGSIDDGDKSPLAAAQKELREETGFEASDWQQIVVANGVKGISNQLIYTFIAGGLKQTGSNTQKSEGIDDMRFISMEDFEKEVKGGAITDAETIFAVLTAKLFL